MIKTISVFDKDVLKEGMTIHVKYKLDVNSSNLDYEFYAIITSVSDSNIVFDDVNNPVYHDISIPINEILRGNAVIEIKNINT